MLVKVHKSYRNIVAICDSELLGKKFQDEKAQIDLSGEFFNGKEKTEPETLEIIEDARREDSTFNIVGEKSCKLAIESGIISKQGIKKIQGIPVALVLL